jgi:hypothetical protein
VTSHNEQKTKAIRFGAFNPLNAELNPICHLLALLGAHLIFHVSEIRVNYSIVVNAHRVTSMADTDTDAVRKQKKTE